MVYVGDQYKHPLFKEEGMALDEKEKYEFGVPERHKQKALNQKISQCLVSSGGGRTLNPDLHSVGRTEGRAGDTTAGGGMDRCRDKKGSGVGGMSRCAGRGGLSQGCRWWGRGGQGLS